MSKMVSFRLDDVTMALLDRMMEQLESEGKKANRTDLVQKAVWLYAREVLLTPEVVMEIIDKHYKD